MFDDVKQNMTSEEKSSSQNRPVEDIFSETEQNQEKISNQDLSPNQINAMTDIYQTERQNRNNTGRQKVLIFFLSLVILAAVGVGGYFVYSKFFAGQVAADKEESTIIPTDSETTTSPTTTNIVTGGFVDGDNDGLSDEEEASYNTDSMNPDTDGDGLFDREEIKIYGTDPMNPDTDEDGYLDGEEVKGGYNPLGPGRLWPENPALIENPAE